MGESTVHHLNRLKQIHEQRLQILEIQAAKFGLSTPPHLLIEIEELREKIKEAETQLVALDINEKNHTPDGHDTLVQLRLKLVAHFSVEELRTLCFDLGIDSENFPSLKDSFCRELVSYCSRNRLISELMESCRQKRPSVSW